MDGFTRFGLKSVACQLVLKTNHRLLRLVDSVIKTQCQRDLAELWAVEAGGHLACPMDG